MQVLVPIGSSGMQHALISTQASPAGQLALVAQAAPGMGHVGSSWTHTRLPSALRVQRQEAPQATAVGPQYDTLVAGQVLEGKHEPA